MSASAAATTPPDPLASSLPSRRMPAASGGCRPARAAPVGVSLLAHAALAALAWQSLAEPPATPAAAPESTEVQWLDTAQPAWSPAPAHPDSPARSRLAAPSAPRPPMLSQRTAAGPALLQAPAADAPATASPTPAAAPPPAATAAPETSAAVTPPAAAGSAPVPVPAAGVALEPAGPRTLDIQRVRYRVPPVLVYPPASRRAQEEGQVQVRLLVDVSGLPTQVELARSSGHARLDEAALASAGLSRFHPHTENGQPRPFRVLVPFVFELEN